MKRILILSGTTEANALARRLIDSPDRWHVILSFAGRTADPRHPDVAVRVGGFGGAEGLTDYIVDEKIDIAIDATHPFAQNMRWNIEEACRGAGIPRLRIERPAWIEAPGDRWIKVPNLDSAVAALRPAKRIFLTIGRQELAAFSELTDKWFLVRAIEEPDLDPPLPGEILLARGPFDPDEERDLLTRYRIDTIVSKNSGGTATEAKLTAARELGVAVVMVERPTNPPGPLVETVDAALAWLEGI